MIVHVKTPDDAPDGRTLCREPDAGVTKAYVEYTGRDAYLHEKARIIAEGAEVCEHCDHEAIKLKDEGPVHIHLHVNEFIDAWNSRTMVAHELPPRDCYIIAESAEHVAREWESWKSGYPDVEKCEECFNLLNYALAGLYPPAGKSVAPSQPVEGGGRLEIAILEEPGGHVVHLATGSGPFDYETYGPFASREEAEAKESELREHPPENAKLS